MFEQTFVEDAQKTAKPLSLFVSTLFQIAALCVLLLIPLVYTSTLPGPVWKNLLMAPPPPVAESKPTAPKSQPMRVVRVLTGQRLIAPRAVPKQVNTISDAGAAPEVAPLGAAQGPAGPATSFDSLLPEGIPTAPPPMELPKLKPASSPVKIGTGVAEANLTRKVMPVYPALAKAARVEGVVEFSAIISRDGEIENLQLVKGHPLLVQAAREAVLQWRYRPTLLNGKPVEVITSIVVHFQLTQ